MPRSDHLPARADDWVFLAMCRCQRCGRELTIRRYPGDAFDRPSYRDLTLCAACARPR